MKIAISIEDKTIISKTVKRLTVISTLIFFASIASAQEKPRKVIDLGQVIITATKTKHTLGDVPAIVEVITKEEIKARNIKTVQDALMLVNRNKD